MKNGRIKEQRCRIEGYKSRYEEWKDKIRRCRIEGYKSRDVEWKGKKVDMENGRIKYGDVE